MGSKPHMPEPAAAAEPLPPTVSRADEAAGIEAQKERKGALSTFLAGARGGGEGRQSALSTMFKKLLGE